MMATLNDLQTISSGDSLDNEIINNNINTLNEVALVGTTINDIPTFSYDSKITAEAITNAFTKIKEAWVDVNQITATSSHVLNTAKFIDKTGALIDGTMPIGIINNPTVSGFTVDLLSNSDESQELIIKLKQKISEGFVNTANNTITLPILKRGRGYNSNVDTTSRTDNPIKCDILLSKSRPTSSSTSGSYLRFSFPDLYIEQILVVIAQIKSPSGEYAFVTLNRFGDDWEPKFWLSTKDFTSVTTSTSTTIYDDHSITLNTNYWADWFGTSTLNTKVTAQYVDILYTDYEFY